MADPRKILHLLSQRPSFTGSGISLGAIVSLANAAGWDQRVVVGAPSEDPCPPVGGLAPDRIHPLVFERGDLDFPLPGMSDVMPYRSSRWSSLSSLQLATYRDAWRRHIGQVVEAFRPDIIHSRHIWLLSSIVKDIAPDIPVVNHCHATGLRQMELCPHLAEEIRRGCARNERFAVLHTGQADALASKLGISHERIHIVGTGYRRELFHAIGRKPTSAPSLVYVGKYSHAKGLPQLLDAFERLLKDRPVTDMPSLVLHVAGDGAGPEAERLRDRMEAMAPYVIMHGQLSQKDLSDLLRQSSVFVLPSFYEGLPLVLIEALACGCRLVCTDLPGVRHSMGSRLDDVLDRVPMPRLIGPDVPVKDDLPRFVDELSTTLSTALDKPPLQDPARTMGNILEPFTWNAVFQRIEKIWLVLISGQK